MYWRAPHADQLAAFGLEADDVRPGDVEVWPDNVEIVDVFAHLYTQWRIGARGPIGLDYTAIPAVLQLLQIPANRHAEVFAGIRIMENTALAEMNGD